MPQQNKEIFSLDELLNIEVFRLDYKFAISNKSYLVAFEVGRPISSSKLGTNQFGSQHEELDIYIAKLSEDTHCHKLLANKAINLTGKQESFCPVWNPSGTYLAFVLLELSETSEYSLCVWCSKTDTILKLSKISSVNRYNAHKTFFWKNDSQILYTNQLNENISFDLLINPSKSAYMDLKNTRHNLCSTEKVFDENKALVNKDDYLLSCISISEAFNEETLKSSVIHSGHTYQINGIGALFSEECRCYLIPLETDSLTSKREAGYTSKFKIVNSESLSDSTEINCYPYKICFEKILPCANTSNVWVKLINQESSRCWLGRINLKEKKLVCHTDNVFYFNKLRSNLCQLVQSDKYVFFIVDDKDTDKTLWIRFNKRTETHENLSYLLSDSKGMLFYCGKGIFIHEDEGVLTKYDWQSNNPTKQIININSKEDAHYSIVWPRPQRINSILINHNSNQNFCMIRLNNGESSKYFITENGMDFTSIKMPQEHQIMGITKLQDKFNVLALVTHEDGNDLVLVSRDHTRTLAKFNIHMKGINKAKKAYFSCNHSEEKVFCEVMLSDNTVLEKPTILFLYPGLQYHASSHSYLHNYSLPPIFNHHIFTANGINCLFVGLPITKTNIVKEGIFENFSEILASGIEKAHKLGYINKNNLFIQGQSWGAFVAMGVLSIMDTFRGCIASSGCYNPIAEYGVFDPNTEHSHSNIPSSCYLTRNSLVTNVHPWDDIDYYMKSSPFIRVKDINTPVLLLHGEQDYVVRSFQSEQMYTALSLLGKPVKLIKYGGEGHIISSEKNIRHAWSSMLDFVNNHKIYA